MCGDRNRRWVGWLGSVGAEGRNVKKKEGRGRRGSSQGGLNQEQEVSLRKAVEIGR